jgi:hypothetical protein
MADQPFPWRRTFILGFGFFGISIIWPLFNSLIPPMLEDLGLAATVIGFIMTWDNIIKKMMSGPPGSGKTLLARSLPSTPSVCRAHWHLRWRGKCQCKCDPHRGAGRDAYLLGRRHRAACPATCR